jgi:hypothetical protein
VSFVLANLVYKNSDGSYGLDGYLGFAFGAFGMFVGIRAIVQALRGSQPPPPSRVHLLVGGLVVIGTGIGAILYVMSTKPGAYY